VVLSEADLARYERAARSAGLSLSEWVRQALNTADRSASVGNVDAKLAAVRHALTYSSPAPDVGQMLSEIEAGYLGGREP
jgi:hypothetical protein